MVKTTKELLDVEHIKFMCNEVQDFSFKDYIGNYKSSHECDKIIGLKIIKTTKPVSYAQLYTRAYQK